MLVTIEVIKHYLGLVSKSDNFGHNINLCLDDPISKLFHELLLHVWIAICTMF